MKAKIVMKFLLAIGLALGAITSGYGDNFRMLDPVETKKDITIEFEFTRILGDSESKQSIRNKNATQIRESIISYLKTNKSIEVGIYNRKTTLGRDTSSYQESIEIETLFGAEITIDELEENQVLKGDQILIKSRYKVLIDKTAVNNRIQQIQNEKIAIEQKRAMLYNDTQILNMSSLFYDEIRSQIPNKVIKSTYHDPNLKNTAVLSIFDERKKDANKLEKDTKGQFYLRKYVDEVVTEFRFSSDEFWNVINKAEELIGLIVTKSEYVKKSKRITGKKIHIPPRYNAFFMRPINMYFEYDGGMKFDEFVSLVRDGDQNYLYITVPSPCISLRSTISCATSYSSGSTEHKERASDARRACGKLEETQKLKRCYERFDLDYLKDGALNGNLFVYVD